MSLRYKMFGKSLHVLGQPKGQEVFEFMAKMGRDGFQRFTMPVSAKDRLPRWTRKYICVGYLFPEFRRYWAGYAVQRLICGARPEEIAGEIYRNSHGHAIPRVRTVIRWLYQNPRSRILMELRRRNSPDANPSPRKSWTNGITSGLMERLIRYGWRARFYEFSISESTQRERELEKRERVQGPAKTGGREGPKSRFSTVDARPG